MKYGFYEFSPVLPWHGQPVEDRRFRRILRILLLISLIFIIIVSLTPRPVVDRQEVETIPPRLAKMILERKKIPPPPPKVEKPKEKEKVKEKPKEKKKAEKKPDKKKPLKKVQKQARKVAKKEIAQFSSILAELSDMKPLPTNKKPLSSSGKKAAQVQREMITSRATQSSGGVSSGRASHTSSSKQSLSNVGTTRIASSLSSVTAATTAAAATEKSDRRSREQINRVFDQNKGALYALYNRALRKNPSLAGEVNVKIKISPDGIVISCKVTSSDIDDKELLRKLTARIKLFNFGSADVKPWEDTVVWDFIPS